MFRARYRVFLGEEEVASALAQRCVSPPAPCTQIWGGERCPPLCSQGQAAVMAVGNTAPSEITPFSSSWQFPLTTRASRRTVPASELPGGCSAVLGHGTVCPHPGSTAGAPPSPPGSPLPHSSAAGHHAPACFLSTPKL